MESFSLTDMHDRPDEVFDRATKEPILLTEDTRGEYVLLSLEDYRQLREQLETWEDRFLGESAKRAIALSRMVGTETFTEELARLAALDEGDREHGETRRSGNCFRLSQGVTTENCGANR